MKKPLYIDPKFLSFSVKALVLGLSLTSATAQTIVNPLITDPANSSSDQISGPDSTNSEEPELSDSSGEDVTLEDLEPEETTEDLLGVDSIKSDLPETLQESSLLGFDGDTRSDSSQGFAYALRISQAYSSNLSLREADVEGSFITGISPSISYRSAGIGRARFIYGFSYEPTFSIYRGGNDDEIFDQRISTVMSWEGAKTNFQFSGSYDQSSRSNTRVNDFRRSTRTQAKFDFSHRYSDKTTINLDADFYRSEISNSNFGSTDGISATASVLWHYSPILKVGPAFKFSEIQSESVNDVRSLGTSIRFDYKPEGKLSGRLDLGMEYAEVIGVSGSDNISPSAQLSLRYKVDEIWSLRAQAAYQTLGIQRLRNRARNFDLDDELAASSGDASQQFNGSLGLTYNPPGDWSASFGASFRETPSTLGREEVSSNFGWQGQIRRSFGIPFAAINYSERYTDYSSVDGEQSRDDRTVRTVGISYVDPLFYSRFVFTANVSYTQSSGNFDYDQTFSSVSLSYRF